MRRLIYRLPHLAAYACSGLVLLMLVGYRQRSDQQSSQATQRQQIRPGVERWAVKTGTDSTVDLVHEKENSTVELLVNLPRPSALPFARHNPEYESARVPPIEATIYTVKATLISFQLELDGDLYLVLKGESGKTMVAEIPNPAPQFVSSESRFFKDIAAARRAFTKRYAVTSHTYTRVPVNDKVSITGIGFFDYIHGQRGLAPNGIELHPVLDIHFDQAVRTKGK